jgi:hypothetical protein
MRKDAAIPYPVANGFRNSLEALLPIKGDRRTENVEGWGFNRIEFWLPERVIMPNNGEAPRVLGKKITALIEVGDLLGHYCEVAEAKRPIIVTQLERKIQIILGPHQ